MTIPSSVTLLRETLDSRWLAELEGDDLRVDARLPLPNGDFVTFHLLIDAVGSVVRAREVNPRRIPRCAARHLFADETFCLGYGLTGPPAVIDTTTAQVWWALLRGYLELQIIAELTGEWDPRYERAHGGAAAFVEEHLEVVALLLPPLAAAIRSGELRASDRPGRVTRRRAPCPCGSGRQLRECHEQLAAMYLAGAAAVHELEKQAWAATPGPCCETMRRCPLRHNQEAL